MMEFLLMIAVLRSLVALTMSMQEYCANGLIGKHSASEQGFPWTQQIRYASSGIIGFFGWVDALETAVIHDTMSQGFVEKAVLGN